MDEKKCLWKTAPDVPQGWPRTLKGKKAPSLQLPVAYRWGLNSLLVTFLSDDLETSQM